MDNCGFSMGRYFQNMEQIGGAFVGADKENADQLRQTEEEIREKIQAGLAYGKADEDLNRKGEFSVMQRIEALVDEGSWCPLDSLFNPGDNKWGTTSVVNGLAKVAGKWVVILASDSKKLAGAMVPGQPENVQRALNTAKLLHIPVVHLLNCSGVKLDVQEQIYANRNGLGSAFYKNASLQQSGVPVIVAVYGTNPAGGGYQSMGATALIAHKKANVSVGGASIMGGMNAKDHMDDEAVQGIVASSKKPAGEVPGTVSMHHDVTGFMREVCEDETAVVETVRKYVACLPAYDRDFFRVDRPQAPALDAGDLYSLLPVNQKRSYAVEEILGRLVDGSQFMEFKGDYGPEIIAGLAKVSGYLVGIVANRQGVFENYPEYKTDSVGVGGRVYRQGMLKMNEFATLCARDRIPLIWFQDNTGVDVGNDAERAELLGLGQALAYSIQNSGMPSMEVTLRKSTSAVHYVMGGPQGGDNNTFSIGTAASEIYVMNGATAATAMYSRKLVREYNAGEDVSDTVAKMNAMMQDYHDKSRPAYIAKLGLLDEIVPLSALRKYLVAFTEAAYQNPKSICPFQLMLTPRVTRDYDRRMPERTAETAAAPTGQVTAAFDACVQTVCVCQGQQVKKGQRLAVLEAMKMEMDVTSPADGVVTQLCMAPGAQIAKGDTLAVVE